MYIYKSIKGCFFADLPKLYAYSSRVDFEYESITCSLEREKKLMKMGLKILRIICSGWKWKWKSYVVYSENVSHSSIRNFKCSTATQLIQILTELYTQRNYKVMKWFKVAESWWTNKRELPENLNSSVIWSYFPKTNSIGPTNSLPREFELKFEAQINLNFCWATVY